MQSFNYAIKSVLIRYYFDLHTQDLDRCNNYP